MTDVSPKDAKWNVIEAPRLLPLMLQDSVLANFEYWGDFVLRIQRDELIRHPDLQAMFPSSRIPSLLCLRLVNTWLGGEKQWQKSVENFPWKGTLPIPKEAPMQAALIMTLLDQRISRVEISNSGDLRLDFSDERSLTVRGRGGESEFSWLLELPSDDPDREDWSIVCESDGQVSCKFPSPHRKN